MLLFILSYFFFNETATTEIYTYWHTLSLHDALPIYPQIPRQLAAKGAAVHAAPPAHADLKPQLAGAITQDQFHLGIALKAFRHARHFLARALPARHVAGAIEAVALLFEALPAFHEPIGAQVRIGPHARLLGHRLDH